MTSHSDQAKRIVALLVERPELLAAVLKELRLLNPKLAEPWDVEGRPQGISGARRRDPITGDNLAYVTQELNDTWHVTFPLVSNAGPKRGFPTRYQAMVYADQRLREEGYETLGPVPVPEAGSNTTPPA
jgi:hypothetical protein